MLRRFNNTKEIKRPGNEKVIKPHPAEPQSTDTQQNPQAWTLISRNHLLLKHWISFHWCTYNKNNNIHCSALNMSLMTDYLFLFY